MEIHAAQAIDIESIGIADPVKHLLIFYFTASTVSTTGVTVTAVPVTPAPAAIPVGGK